MKYFLIFLLSIAMFATGFFTNRFISKESLEMRLIPYMDQNNNLHLIADVRDKERGAVFLSYTTWGKRDKPLVIEGISSYQAFVLDSSVVFTDKDIRMIKSQKNTEELHITGHDVDVILWQWMHQEAK